MGRRWASATYCVPRDWNASSLFNWLRSWDSLYRLIRCLSTRGSNPCAPRSTFCCRLIRDTFFPASRCRCMTISRNAWISAFVAIWNRPGTPLSVPGPVCHPFAGLGELEVDELPLGRLFVVGGDIDA